MAAAQMVTVRNRRGHLVVLGSADKDRAPIDVPQDGLQIEASEWAKMKETPSVAQALAAGTIEAVVAA